MSVKGLPFIIILLVLSYLSTTIAQEQISYSFSHPSDVNEYTVQHIIEVNDVPGHIIRIASIVSAEEDGWLSLDPPVEFNGIKVASTEAHFSTDYINFNGMLEGYMIYHMENGDKIFAELKGAAQTKFKDDGTLDVSHYSGVDTFTGGTGMFEGIRGMFRHTSVTDPTRGVGPTVDRDGSYWFVGQ